MLRQARHAVQLNEHLEHAVGLAPESHPIGGLVLGLLDGRQLSAVFEAYLALRTLTWRLRRLEQEDERFKPEPDHVWLTSRNFKRANQLHDQMIPTIDAAIDELDRSASPRPTWREKTAIAL
jgi:hypothetical protein